jgi:ribosomal protein S18 acetylase RimI-like enzyme
MEENINKEINRIKNLIFESKENTIIEHFGEDNSFPGSKIIFKTNSNNNICSTEYTNFRVARLYDESLNDFITENNDSDLKYKNIDNSAYFFNFEVNENFRGLGYGKKMLNKLIEECQKKEFKKLFFSVNKNNENALKLYEKFNYHKLYENKNEILGVFFI